MEQKNIRYATMMNNLFLCDGHMFQQTTFVTRIHSCSFS